jgi:hypothetical protein
MSSRMTSGPTASQRLRVSELEEMTTAGSACRRQRSVSGMRAAVTHAYSGLSREAQRILCRPERALTVRGGGPPWPRLMPAVWALAPRWRSRSSSLYPTAQP